MYKLLFLIFCFFIIQNNASSQSSLDFDGDNRLRILGAYNSDVTIEFWFKNEHIGPCVNPKILMGIGNTSEITLCNGEMLFKTSGTSTNIMNGISNDWHHLAVTIDYDELMPTNPKILSVILDCVNINSTNINTSPFFSDLFLGNNHIFPLTSDGWIGLIDELRVWNKVLPISDIDKMKHCPCLGNEQDIRICMPLDDLDLPSSGRTPDLAPNNGFTHGFLDFNMSGTPLNLSVITAPIIYPVMNDIHIKFTEYFNNNVEISTVCSGEKAHVLLVDENDMPVPLNPTTPNTTFSFYWQIFDSGINDFIDLPNYFGPVFNIPDSDFTIDCSNNGNGYEEKKYRVKIKVKDVLLNDSCWYLSDTVTMKICCPFDQTNMLNVTFSNNNLLCETDVINLTASIVSGQPFINPLGPDVTINWYIDGVYYNSYDYQLSINLTNQSLNSPSFCIKAVIKNCDCDPIVLEHCVDVDLQPTCDLGLITAMDGSIANSVEQISTDYFEICPGTDAVLKIVNPGSFANGNVVWQWRFVNPFTAWTDMGVSNSQQNTNILPIDDPLGSTLLWPPGQNCIQYRIANVPFNNPSGCDTCFSNVITVCLEERVDDGVISGPEKFCAGSFAPLTINPFDNAFNYVWFQNGVEILNGGQTLQATESGCYWAEVRDRCGVSFTTNTHCVEECLVVPIISCPLADNPCACLGQAITLSGCNSLDSCNEVPLAYNWSFSNGTQVSPSNQLCEFQHIPDGAGTTYTLTVTNALGCSSTVSKTIIPCQN